MKPEDEVAIIARFARALKGRYGTLKSAKAIAICLGYIAKLRAEHLAWAEIDRLFNKALREMGCDLLSPGSVSRLYHVAASRKRPTAHTSAPMQAGPSAQTRTAQPMVQSLSPLPYPSAPSQPRHRQPHALPAFDQTPGGTKDETDVTDPHLERLRERREAKRRMDEA